MASYDQMNAMTSTTLDNLIPEFWDREIRSEARRESFWDSKNLVGKERAMKAIVEKYDPMKEPMDTIHMNVVSNLKGAGTTGETLLLGQEEKQSVGQFDLTIDWLDHAVGLTKKANKLALKGAVMLAGTQLSMWLATKLSDDIFKEMLVTALAKMGVLYANSVTSTASTLATPCSLVTATSGDSVNSLDLTDISMAKLALVRKKAVPLMVTRDNGVRQKWYGIVIDDIDGFRLMDTDKWAQAQRDANVRGDSNPIFTGSIGVWDGMIVYTYGGLTGEKGSPMRPEGTLNALLTQESGGTGIVTSSGESSGVVTIGNTTAAADGIDYTRNFPSTGIFWVDNPTDCTSAEIKKVAVKYTGKGTDGCSFTGCTATIDTFGDTPPLAAADTVITLENTSRNLAFGGEMCARGWGLMPRKLSNTESYGQHIGVGIECVYGVKAIENVAGNVPNAVILKTFSKNPGDI